MSEDAQHLIMRLLDPNPATRLGANGLLFFSILY